MSDSVLYASYQTFGKAQSDFFGRIYRTILAERSKTQRRAIRLSILNINKESHLRQLHKWLLSGGHGIRTRNPLRGTTFPVWPLAIRLPS
jgi:hypothetical protein